MSDLAEHVDKSDNPFVSLAYADSPTANTLPFDLIDNTRLRMFRPMTVGDVLKLNVQEAIEAGGNLYDALIKQLARDTNKETKNKFPKIERVEQWFDAAMRVFDFISFDTAEGREHADAIRARMAQKSGGTHAVEVVGRGMSDFKELWSDALQVKYSRLIDDKLAQGDDKPADAKAA